MANIAHIVPIKLMSVVWHIGRIATRCQIKCRFLR